MGNFNEFVKSDDALFHYTSFNVAIEHIIDKDELRLTSLINTNDPLEYKYKVFDAVGWEL